MRKNQTLRRLFSKTAATLALMLLTTATAWAQSDHGNCGNGVGWKLNEGTLTISGEGTMFDFTANSAPWYSYRENIRTVVIENGVTNIGNNAFMRCSGLSSVTIPNSVTSIGGMAFFGCSGLTYIDIPNTVTLEKIGDNAFRECTNLELLVRMYNLGRGLSDQGTRIFPNTVKGIFIPALVTDLQEDDLDDFNFMKHVFYEGSKSNMERTFHTAFNTTYDDNTTLFGIWGFGSDSRIHWYSTVTFDMQGVLANTTREQVWSGWDTVECPTAPTAKGYDFGGWYKDEACTEPFGTTKNVGGVSVTSGTIPGDISIYAK